MRIVSCLFSYKNKKSVGCGDKAKVAEGDVVNAEKDDDSRKREEGQRRGKFFIDSKKKSESEDYFKEAVDGKKDFSGDERNGVDPDWYEPYPCGWVKK